LSNYYGYTSSVWDINEGNAFIDSLFRKGTDPDIIRKRFVRMLSRLRIDNSVPFIFKNVRNYNHILDLHRALPEIVFLRIRRNTFQVVQSELRAHYELGTFHPIPAKLKDIPSTDPLVFTVQQITEIERELDVQFREIDENNKIEWHYEEFCENMMHQIENLADKHLGVDSSLLRADVIKFPLKASMRRKVSEEEADRIAHLLEENNRNA
jgi:hypothetical protein